MIDKNLIITGMHRSGTSMIAQALYRSGLYLGKKLFAPSQYNPDGYFENIKIIEYHDSLLKENGIAWHNPEITTRNISIPKNYMLKAERLINSEYRNRDLWGWKDPRTTIFLNMWKEILPNGKYLFIYREPKNVIWSLVRRGDFWKYSDSQTKQGKIAANLWVFYNRQIITFAQKFPEMCLLILFPDDLFKPLERKLINTTVCKEWGIELSDLEQNLLHVYKPKLLKQNVPLWIKLSKWFYPSLTSTYRKLTNLHLSLINRHSFVNSSYKLD